MAQLLMRDRAATDAGLAVSSAGLRALVGQGVDAGSAAALRRRGIDPSGHRARQFEGWMARDADLVLTAEREHRDEIMQAFPPAFRRTFTLREFARAVQHAGSSDPREVVAQAAAARHLDGEVALADDDVADPFGADEEQAGRVLDEIDAAVRTSLAALGLAERPRRRPSPRGPLAAASRRPLPYQR